MTVLMPKLNGQSAPEIYDWANRVIAFFEQQVVLETVDSAAGLVDVPTGTVLDYAYVGATPPTGFLLTNGTVLARATWPDLFAVVGTSFNTGGETGSQFRLPNQTVTINGVVCKRIIRHD